MSRVGKIQGSDPAHCRCAVKKTFAKGLTESFLCDTLLSVAKRESYGEVSKRGRLRAPPVADTASKKEWRRSKFRAAKASEEFREPQQDITGRCPVGNSKTKGYCLNGRNDIRRGIEGVITGLTRNQFVGNHTRVRIPPSPPKSLENTGFSGLFFIRILPNEHFFHARKSEKQPSFCSLLHKCKVKQNPGNPCKIRVSGVYGEKNGREIFSGIGFALVLTSLSLRFRLVIRRFNILRSIIETVQRPRSVNCGAGYSLAEFLKQIREVFHPIGCLNSRVHLLLWESANHLIS